jgi:hypothetical protein
MGIDFTKLTGGQIALLTSAGVVVASVVAALGAFIVAKVNARSARLLARVTAKREHYRVVAEPFLTRVEADVPRLVKAAQAVARLYLHAAGLLEGFQAKLTQPEEEKRRFREAMRRLYTFNAFYSDLSPAVRSLFTRDAAMSAAHERLLKARRDADGLLEASFDDLINGVTDRYEPDEMDKSVNAVLDATLALRIAVEDFIYR